MSSMWEMGRRGTAIWGWAGIASCTRKHHVFGCNGYSDGNGGCAIDDICSMISVHHHPTPSIVVMTSPPFWTLLPCGDHWQLEVITAADPVVFPQKSLLSRVWVDAELCTSALARLWPTHSWGEILSTWDHVEARPREPGWLFWMFGPENLAQGTKRVFKIEIAETFSEFIIWLHYFYLGQLPAWRPPINFGRKGWKAVK